MGNAEKNNFQSHVLFQSYAKTYFETNSISIAVILKIGGNMREKREYVGISIKQGCIKSLKSNVLRCFAR